MKGDYVFDVESMIKFIFEGQKDSSTEITESYVIDDDTKELYLANKVIREVKNSGSNNITTIKYDLLKMFMETLLDIEGSDSSSPITFGEETIINTLLENGIIKEKS